MRWPMVLCAIFWVIEATKLRRSPRTSSAVKSEPSEIVSTTNPKTTAPTKKSNSRVKGKRPNLACQQNIELLQKHGSHVNVPGCEPSVPLRIISTMSPNGTMIRQPPPTKTLDNGNGPNLVCHQDTRPLQKSLLCEGPLNLSQINTVPTNLQDVHDHKVATLKASITETENAEFIKQKPFHQNPQLMASGQSLMIDPLDDQTTEPTQPQNKPEDQPYLARVCFTQSNNTLPVPQHSGMSQPSLAMATDPAINPSPAHLQPPIMMANWQTNNLPLLLLPLKSLPMMIPGPLAFGYRCYYGPLLNNRGYGFEKSFNSFGFKIDHSRAAIFDGLGRDHTANVAPRKPCPVITLEEFQDDKLFQESLPIVEHGLYVALIKANVHQTILGVKSIGNPPICAALFRPKGNRYEKVQSSESSPIFNYTAQENDIILIGDCQAIAISQWFVLDCRLEVLVRSLMVDYGGMFYVALQVTKVR